jgi:hypothetical protein
VNPIPLTTALLEAFAIDLIALPPLTLRGANDVDDYRSPAIYDPQADRVSDEYLERYHYGVAHLDARSWRHYLPLLLSYGSRHRQRDTDVMQAVLWSLRPPDRDPPRLATLSSGQIDVIESWLATLAGDERCAQREFVSQVYREWRSPFLGGLAASESTSTHG